MSDIIHLLPDSVANQIAAGEVIQRPASVIKELVENALDAGATHVQIVVEDAGKALVQVIDNGKGMSETDARLSFERHATSKITQATDLFALRTMGFRGEALASIAAVAQVELKTRQAGSDLGTCINIEGSKVVSQEVVGCPVGANFAIRNLFFNIPARRKFLKSNQTELSNIMAELERVALAHPDVAFTLHAGSNVMLELAAGNFRQRIVGIFGRRIDSQLVPIKVDTTLVQINGFVGMPSAAKRKNAHQFLFVNGRFMRHPYFVKAIMMAYERLIQDGLQIPFFINFDVDPARIDVNIHPTKTEIKFEDDNAIFQILLAAVRESLGKYGAVPALDFDTEARPDIPTFSNDEQSRANVAPPQIHVNTSFNPFDTSGGAAEEPSMNSVPGKSASNVNFSRHFQSAPIDWQSVYNNAQSAVPTNGDEDEEIESHYQEAVSLENNNIMPSKQPLFDSLPESEREEINEATFSDDFIQCNGRYIFTPYKKGVALIDQHKAHVRILYERYMRLLVDHKAPSQRLLFPEMLTVSPSEAVVVEQITPQLLEVGFDVSPLGNGSYSILAVPFGTEGLSPSSLVQSILADAVSGQANASDAVGHIVSLALARKVAMPVGQLLSCEEMRELTLQLFRCASPNLTPDGKPTLTIIYPERLL